jgi:uncharacterized membrane protein YphA (DoxX/SURF4 family)
MEHGSAPAAATRFAWEDPLRRITVVLGRLGLALLFFTQLFWKLPPRFGCGPGNGFSFTHFDDKGQLVRTSGLCDWVGIEASYADQDRRFLVTPGPDGGRLFSIGLGPLVKLNGLFVEGVVQPAFGLFGWAIFLLEAFIAVSMLLGLFTRAGALASLFLSLQLMLGLAGIWNPAAQINEWEWSYHLMILLSLVLLGLAPGRILGVDAWLRPRLTAAAEGGNRVARLLLALT